MLFEPHPLELRILHEAHDRWGLEHEHRMAVEELAETITALCHFGRDRVPINKVIEEMGDAIVCVAQSIYAETGSTKALEVAIERSFIKLQKKLEAGDMNYKEGRI